MIERLFSLKGRFVGRGINHEGQDFTGVFEAKPTAQGKGLYLTFDATGDDGRAYHGESSLIGKNMAGKPALWVLSSNHPGVFERPLKSHDAASDVTTYIFGYGEPSDRASFREEILISVGAKSVKYVYSWGLPGGDSPKDPAAR